jgi:hypothetical protein
MERSIGDGDVTYWISDIGCVLLYYSIGDRVGAESERAIGD